MSLNVSCNSSRGCNRWQLIVLSQTIVEIPGVFLGLEHASTVWGAILDISCWRISFSLSTSFEHKKRICVLLPRLQFRKHENQPWTGVTFDKVAGFSVVQRSYEILSFCLSVCQLVRFFDCLFLRKLLPDLREEIFWLFIG